MRLLPGRPMAACVSLVLLLGACGDDDGEGAGGSVTVFAAASLTDAFTELGTAFEAANPGVTVAFNFGPSSGLREQILAGAPADVFASANEANMAALVEDGAASGAEDFAANELQIAVPAGNPGDVTGLDDFADPDLLVGLCAEQVPCGDLGRQVLDGAGVTPSVDTNALDVRGLLTLLESGDLDAGLVYRTDVRAADGAVEGIEIPAGQNASTRYPIAALADADDRALADAFVAYVLADEGQAILADFGFDPP